ncbi:hypothetical protein [Streptomyces sp. NPDC002573]|uniref:hypothetical protein n=1 Tax=Streptomyces sp. NPDC002573 TaxID=3364651 RepID=UPI0036CF5DCA
MTAVFGVQTTLGPEQTMAVVAVCPSGRTAIAGGWMTRDEVVPVRSFRTTSTTDNDSWTISFHNAPTTQEYLITPIVYCVP